MSESEFNPPDMEYLSDRFEQIIRDTENGYCVEFHITRLAAREMINEWIKAITGDLDAYRKCMDNYGYIVTCIMDEVNKDDKDDIQRMD